MFNDKPIEKLKGQVEVALMEMQGDGKQSWPFSALGERE